MTTHPRILKAVVAGAVALTVAAGGSALGASSSASAAPAAGDGWVRIGHFSPDTKGVDVQLAALAGGSSSSTDLSNVTYGQVSKYLEMPAGTYALSMRPAGSSPSSQAMLSQSVTVKAGTAITVAAYGRNKSLKTAVYQDDLTSPAPGQARIRLIQVSTKHPEVSVATSTGVAIAKDARLGQATGYASVAAGPWDLKVTGSGADDSEQVTLADGSVNTLLVLDNATGGVSLDTLVDSASVGQQPTGGVQTGGGFFATHHVSPDSSLVFGSVPGTK